MKKITSLLSSYSSTDSCNSCLHKSSAQHILYTRYSHIDYIHDAKNRHQPSYSQFLVTALALYAFLVYTMKVYTYQFGIYHMEKEQKLQRIQRGLKLVDQVEILSSTTALVYSRTNVATRYHVNFVQKTCDCPDYIHRGAKCKHISAAVIKANFLEAED